MPVVFALSPILIVAAGALLLMLGDALSTPSRGAVGSSPPHAGGMALGAAIVLFAGLIFSGATWLYGPWARVGTSALAPWLVVDRFSLFFDAVLCLGGALTALIAGGYLIEHELERGEFYAILLFSTVGAMLLATAGDLVTIFLGLETMSLGAYAMTAFRRGSPRAVEGGLKYFLLGSFAAALMLYGFALLYGATGHTDLAGIGAAIADGSAGGAIVLVALVLVLAGLVFKVSGVPFHMWAPDAYEGAPTPTTTYMAVAVKSGAFAMMLRVLFTAFGDAKSASWASGWPPVLAVVSVLTMTVANLIAGRQSSVKRMLAYSSISHAGLMLTGVVASIRGGADARASVLFYLLTYTVSTAGAFGALVLCGSRGAEAVTYEDLSGIGRRHPAPALAFSLFLVSLAGIPPTAGFFGKWFLFRAAIDNGFYWLAVIGLLNAVVAVYYYLRVLVAMYMQEPAKGAEVATPMRSTYVHAAIVVCAALVLALGLLPTRSLGVAIAAAAGMGG